MRMQPYNRLMALGLVGISTLSGWQISTASAQSSPETTGVKPATAMAFDIDGNSSRREASGSRITPALTVSGTASPLKLLRRPTAEAATALITVQEPPAVSQEPSSDRPATTETSPPATSAVQPPLQLLDKPQAAAEQAVAESDSLTPLQTSEFSSQVAAVNISLMDVGTGLVPASTPFGEQFRVGLPTGMERGVSYKPVHWKPSLVCHYPLYFEDPMLERHGHNRWGCLQPLAAGAKFFGNIPLLPYRATLQPRRECVYALGSYRAGSCAPLLRDQLPYDRNAMVVEALANAGFFWGMPL